MADQTENRRLAAAEACGGPQGQLTRSRRSLPGSVLDFLAERVREGAGHHSPSAHPNQDEPIWTTVPRPDYVDEVDRFFELDYGDCNLRDFALGGASIEGLQNPRRLGSLREVVRHDDRRSMVRCEAA